MRDRALWDPAKHPHRPKGDSRGGEWAPKLDEAHQAERENANAVKLGHLKADYNDKQTAYWHYDPSARAIQEYLAGMGDAIVSPYGYTPMKASDAHAMLLKKLQPVPAMTLYHGGPIHRDLWVAASPFRRVAEAFAGENMGGDGAVYAIEVPAGTEMLIPSAMDMPAEAVFPPGGLPKYVRRIS